MHGALVIVVQVLVLATLAAKPAPAAAERHDRSNDDLYLRMINEARCPASRNMSLAHSDELIAFDRRREIRDLIDGGMNAREIRGFLRRRYGDDALYSPPLRTTTAGLWITPATLITAGILIWLRAVSRTREPA